MSIFKMFGMLLAASILCLSAFSAFTAPSLAAGSDNWTRPYNQYWGNSSVSSSNAFNGCASAWGKSSCILSGNVTTNNSLGLCASAWGNSSCVLLRK